MMLELQPHQLISLITSDESLRAHVDEAAEMLQSSNPGIVQPPSSIVPPSPTVMLDAPQLVIAAPQPVVMLA